MNDETLGETLLEIVTMMLIAIVLALLVMGAFGISLRPFPERVKPVRSAPVHLEVLSTDHPKHSVGPNP